ncbi:putative ABC transport system permease protein [Catenibacillus scindens]|uniref:Putative ABC transport system permease protein n=2 Tax=Catenibacillus scindens TaxID=673271 RepID=A0A7W8H7H2_9FIRM|nr:ABC transporter permease [Catenibacillus scindens]MBB5263311.1 putative ABC transport system permease protein [Catenibacillus scindens]
MLENIRLSFQGVWSHKMRSFLTMLGIIIGIASIIAIVSTIKGTNEQIKQNLVGAGNNTIDIKLMENNYEYYPDNYNIPSSIPILDESLREELLAIPEVDNVSYYLHRNYSDSLYYQNTSYTNMQIYGVDRQYFDTCGFISTKGRTFVDQDFTDFRKVVVLDKDSASTIFPSEDPLGKTLEINGEPFTVIGVVDKASTFKPVINTLEDYYQYSGNQMTTIYIPYDSWPIIYCYDEIPNVVVRAVDTDSMSTAGQKAEDAINAFIGVSTDGTQVPSGDDLLTEDMALDAAASDMSSMDSGTSSQPYTYRGTDIMETARNLQELSASTNQQLIWIASISLLVGGIGVMNIMLVSVTERTQEIGLKKAIGARKSRILGQFLTEAAVLTSLGGLIGIIAGIILAEVISRISSTPVAISVPAIVGSVLFSVVIGIIFGLLPSIKAANLNPIDALRHE